MIQKPEIEDVGVTVIISVCPMTNDDVSEVLKNEQCYSCVHII